MINELIKLLKQNRTLIDQAKDKATKMLSNSEIMFGLAFQIPKDDAEEKFIVEKIRKIDANVVNELHREARQIIVQHLTISKGDDLVQGLILANVIENAERLGDYEKNLVEIPFDLKKRLVEKYSEKFNNLIEVTGKNYKQVINAFKDFNIDLAKEIMSENRKIAKKCDSEIDNLFAESDENITRESLAFILFLRYMKRINGHLNNIATSIVNPYHQIGYLPKDWV